MSIQNLITASVANEIDSQLPISFASGVPVGAVLMRTAYDQISAVHDAVSAVNALAWNQGGSSALTFAFIGGYLHSGRGTLLSPTSGTVALTGSADNYIEYDPSDNTVKKNTSAFTSGRWPMYIVTTGTSSFTSENVQDRRPFGAILYLGAIPSSNLADELADLLNSVGFTVGAEASDTIDITIQAKDAQGNNLSETRMLEVWLADTSTGTLTGTAPDTSMGVQTGTAHRTLTSNKHLMVITNSSGVAVIRIVNTTTRTWYLACAIQDKIQWSGAVAFA